MEKNNYEKCCKCGNTTQWRKTGFDGRFVEFICPDCKEKEDALIIRVAGIIIALFVFFLIIGMSL